MRFRSFWEKSRKSREHWRNGSRDSGSVGERLDGKGETLKTEKMIIHR